MFPSIYLSQYHGLSIKDDALGMSGLADLHRYVSGMPSDNRTEYGRLLSKLCTRHLKIGNTNNVPTWFTIPNDGRIPWYEEFSKPGLRRAYGGRGSYSEIRDAVRLACLVDRCKPGEAKAYAEKWFGQDCNAFVGNYLGISPSSSVTSYVAGYGESGKIKGATSDVYITRDLLPLKPITDVSKIIPGTVIITYRPGTTTRWGNHWAHIGLVDIFGPSAAGDEAVIGIVEWGKKGGVDAHTDSKTIKLLHEDLSGKINRFKGQEIYAFWDHGNKDLRIFLDASPLNHIPSRGWNIGTSYEGVFEDNTSD